MHARFNALKILLIVNDDAEVGVDAMGAVHQREVVHTNISEASSRLFNEVGCF
jgi:hypothetical protein